MDQDQLLATLSPERRLALAYAPAASRPAFLGLFALDARLGSLVRSTREAMLAQVKLAWWREQLARRAEDRPLGEPVLAALAPWATAGEALIALVDGWEHLVGEEPVGAGDITGFAAGRGRACAALADLLGDSESRGDAEACGRRWALVDLAGRLSHPEEDQSVRTAIIAEGWEKPTLSSALRPLVVLNGLAAKARERGFSSLKSGSIFTAMRLGLLGF